MAPLSEPPAAGGDGVKRRFSFSFRRERAAKKARAALEALGYVVEIGASTPQEPDWSVAATGKAQTADKLAADELFRSWASILGGVYGGSESREECAEWLQHDVRTVDLGGVVLGALTDAHGSFMTFREAFPAGEALERVERERFAELFDGPDWVLPFHVFSVVSPETTVLIDAGVGPPGPGPADFLPSRQGWLPDRLPHAGIERADVQTVVLTHLHVDHVGWTFTDGKPYFPRARYVACTGEWSVAETRDAYADRLAPLARAGVLDLVDGETEVAPGVVMFPSPGHTAGHMAVRVEGRERRAVVLGDVLVHPLQLREPELSYAFDDDPAEAARTRRSLLEELADEDVIAAPSHFPRPLGHIVSEGAAFGWVASG